LKAIAIGLIYLISAKLGLSLAESTKQVTTVWPPTGIALVTLYLLGYRYWPAVAVGAFLANLLTQESLVVAAFIAAGNTLEALAGAFLLRRYARFKTSLDSIDAVLALVIFAAFASTLISATIGTTTLSLGGLINWHGYPAVWTRWWVGDMMGDLILAPLLFVLLGRRFWSCLTERPLEAAALLATTLVTTNFIFMTSATQGSQQFPLPYLTFPLTIWAALRFREVGAVTTTFIITSAALLATLHHQGPFASNGSVEVNIIFLYIFIGVVAITSMVLAAAVAERLETEKALLSQAKDLAVAKNRALRSAARQRVTDKQKDQLVSMASHELKTPLTSTKLFTDILQRHLKQTPGSQQAREYTSRISQGLDRLTKLTGDLIDVNRSRSGKLKLDKKLVDIDDLIEKAVTDMQLTTKKHTLHLQLRSQQSIEADEVRVRQVMINLLNNAIRHAPKGSEINVSSTTESPNLVVKIHNSGPHIPKKEQAKIFQPFYQFGTRRTRGQMGLGLYICQQIIDLHRGKIWVESQPKAGATFAFSLPIKAVGGRP